MRVAIANQKGGVGKTTTAVNLGAGLAVRGHRILLVDLDHQANATTGLGIDHRHLEASVYDVLIARAPARDIVQETAVRGLDVLPSSIDLAGAELELVSALARESRLRGALEALSDDYAAVFIDCPPSLGLLTINGLTAADWVLVPIQCEYYALEGLSQLVRNVDLVRNGLNEALVVKGIALTMFDARTKLSEQIADEVRRHFGERVFRSVIPRSVRLSEAPSYGRPAVVLDPASRGSLAYRWLAEEFESRYLQAYTNPKDPKVDIEGLGDEVLDRTEAQKSDVSAQDSDQQRETWIETTVGPVPVAGPDLLRRPEDNPADSGEVPGHPPWDASADGQVRDQPATYQEHKESL